MAASTGILILFNPGTATAPAKSPMGVGEAPIVAAAGPSMALAPTPAAQTAGSSVLAVSTGSVLLSMLLAAYFYSC
ncbi:hypothetical protein L1987_19920 [Smallanthus sonchifolius]|uniref:Uncharacterized protein n=1 Tax=Smallanthus sonchifolius TaxID=185202 RepID=A0ACB9IPZ9_9ASTR|nr:hypothetical protein L1987_19920 [Smallanthus sonchifolius]